MGRLHRAMWRRRPTTAGALRQQARDRTNGNSHQFRHPRRVHMPNSPGTCRAGKSSRRWHLGTRSRAPHHLRRRWRSDRAGQRDRTGCPSRSTRQMLGTLQARLGAILGKASLIAIGTSILGNEDHTEILAVGKCIEIAVEQITHHGNRARGKPRPAARRSSRLP